MHSKLEQKTLTKRLRNKLEISGLFFRLFCSNFTVCLSQDVTKLMIFFQTAPHTPIGKILFILLPFATNTLQVGIKKPTINFRFILQTFWFQLTVYLSRSVSK